MPLINGMKMACEPCIRGHRSTKCTHANERLMVPVRKPGRPLSSCPHPGNQPCGCGSVTAAIPRNQTCHCGGSDSPTPLTASTPAEEAALGAEPPSPTKTVFKIQKPHRPSSSRKQSFDPVNLERMDMSHVNLLPFEQRPPLLPSLLPNTYPAPLHSQIYGDSTQYASIQHQYGPVLMRPPPILHLMDAVRVTERQNGIPERSSSNGEQVGNALLDMPLNNLTSILTPQTASGTCCAKSTTTNGTALDKFETGGSCCGLKEPRRHSSSNGGPLSDVRHFQAGSSKAGAVKHESSSIVSPLNPQGQTPINGNTLHPVLPPGFLPHTTIFTYPSTYGSFQNPLQPSAWRQSVQVNNFTPQLTPNLPPSGLPFEDPLAAENIDTIHACGCGDGCQCVGCAAHPYNDATQSYVRSAWESMEQPSMEVYINTNGQTVANGVVPLQHQGTDVIASPTAHTPSSTTSGNGEEQSLSASDFFFVNYPFMSDRCGGDTQSCPCGDECQCLGCTIHNQPAMPCSGDVERCPCGDDCKCIGCEAHKGS